MMSTTVMVADSAIGGKRKWSAPYGTDHDHRFAYLDAGSASRFSRMRAALPRRSRM